jgi:2,4-dienoyl-CoA reductase-like NADH-dependent reductase (Old Yellow Enzyme family)
MTSALFSPYKINGLELANRIVIAPMCQYSADDGVPAPWHTTHLGMLANSGAALVFVEATGVERIGFEAIQLHMAHGYLLHSFVSPLSNKRNDAYGGSLEGRLKFPVEVVRAVRAAVPKDFALGARISAVDWAEGGLTGDDSVVWVKAMKEAGLDFVDISSGGINADVRTPTTPGYNVPTAEQIKRETGLPTSVVGLIATPQQAEEIIASGKADQIALGRAMLDDPHWGWMAARELGAEVERPNQYLRAAPKLWPGASYKGNAA